jgi:hypothetical protein
MLNQNTCLPSTGSFGISGLTQADYESFHYDENTQTIRNNSFIYSTDLISTNQFISAGTSITKHFVGDEIFFIYYIKDIYYKILDNRLIAKQKGGIMFHVLVVDDDKNIRYVMKEILETAHYTVFVAENGEKAFDVLEKEHVDIVVVDIMMPLMDGYEFTKELRRFNSEIPILMVSA